MQPKHKVIAVIGATASGKTVVSIELAKRFSGEVISADSRQVYRGLDIGTAKTTKEEMQNIPHHLIDIIDIEKTYSAHEFAKQAAQKISDITNRKCLPILTGGTFFYLDMLRGIHQAAQVAPNPELRAELETYSTETLALMLTEKDSVFAEKVDKNNRRRLIRALEIISVVGHMPTSTQNDSNYDWLIIGLQVDKETLRARYRERAEKWLKEGFLEEIAGLLERGIPRERLQEIGFEYTLGLQLLEGKIDTSQFMESFEQKNWQYAKRQLTWLKRNETIKWFKPSEMDKILSTASSFLSN